MASPAVNYARGNQQRFLTELKDLLRIPSISTLSEHKSDVHKAAEFVAAEMRRIGLEHVEVIPTKGHPLIYADWIKAPGKPTALCYAHYDVQPPDPLDEWVSPPFEPTERNNNIYARGAVDDKVEPAEFRVDFREQRVDVAVAADVARQHQWRGFQAF